jgi:hypothetical protein
MKIETTAFKIFLNSQVMLIPDIMTITDDLKKIPDGERLYLTVHTIPGTKQRSVEQNNLFWASCAALAENTDNKEINTKEKVCEYTKIKLRHVDYWIHYKNEKTGEETLNLKTKSIAFENLDFWEACGFFDQAFQLHSEIAGVSLDDWIENVKSRMKTGTT